MTVREAFYTPAGEVRAGWRVLIFLALFLFFYNIVVAAVFFAGRPSDYALFEVEQYLLVLFAVWLAHFIMLRWIDHKSWSYVGLGKDQLTPRIVMLGLALGSFCILIPSGGLLLAHDLTVTTGLQGRHSWFALASGGVALFLPQSLVEEMTSRGYLFSALRDGIGWLGALAATSIGFGLMHAKNPGATPQSIAIVIFAGIFLGAILLATNSLYAAWMAHFAWNWSMAEVLHAAVSGMRFPYSTYRVDDGGPAWLTGGAWGPEGGAAAVAGMFAGIAVLVAWRKQSARAGIVELEAVA